MRISDWSSDVCSSDLRAYNTYGCREFMLIACEAGDRNGLLVNADHLAVDLVDASRRSDGSETGEIAITDLHNLGMPFIRYVNGDVATRSGESLVGEACVAWCTSLRSTKQKKKK